MARRWWWSGSGRRWSLAALALVLLSGAAAAALLATPLTRLEVVSTTGAVRTDPAVVRGAAAPQVGTPLLRLDEDAVRARLADSPYVADVQLVRRWPRGVEVRVRERVPVAGVPAQDGVALVDAAGAVITTVDAAPGDLPLVRVAPRAGQGAVRAASEVARALPEGLRAQVERVEAVSPDDVRLTLRGGALVRWGSSEATADKVAVLDLLRARAPAAVGFDVSAPAAPATW